MARLMVKTSEYMKEFMHIKQTEREEPKQKAAADLVKKWIKEDEEVEEPVYMDFSDALRGMREGGNFMRIGWNSWNQHVFLYTPYNEDGLPFLMIRTVQEKRVPWVPSQTDLLTADWAEVKK